MSDLNWVTTSALLRPTPTAGLPIHTGLRVYARKNQEIRAKGNKWLIKRASVGVSGSQGLESTMKPVSLLWSRNNFVPCPSVPPPPLVYWSAPTARPLSPISACVSSQIQNLSEVCFFNPQLCSYILQCTQCIP